MIIYCYDVVLKDKLPKLEVHGSYNYDELRSARGVVDFCRSRLGLDRKAEEYVYMFSYSGSQAVGVFEISHGSTEYAICNSREVFQRILLTGGNRFIMVHNHPSGNSRPSDNDIRVQSILSGAAEIMGIHFDDFIIVGNDYYSFAEALAS